jgi:hypothetical protein
MIFYTKFTPEELEREVLERLAGAARIAGLDLNTSSEQMFRVSPECLDEAQRAILRAMFYEAYEGKHKHFCGECGSPINCDVTGCTVLEGYDHCDDEPASRPWR